MPHYYFTVSDSAGCELDVDGLEMQDLDAALKYARIIIGDLLKASFIEGENSFPIIVLIDDELRLRVATISTSVKTIQTISPFA